MISRKIKLITFDATNTLLKFRVSPWKYYAKLAEEYGYKVKEDEIRKQFISTYQILSNNYPNFGMGSILWENWWRKIVQGTFREKITDTTTITSIADVLIEDYKSPKCWCAAKGSVELLKCLQAHGISLGVVSNFDPRLHEILRKLYLDTYFTFVLTSYETGYSKPDKKFFESAIIQSKLNALSIECLHIGDDYEKDYKGAKAAGWNAILVTEKVNGLHDLNPTQCYKNLQDLKIDLENEKLLR